MCTNDLALLKSAAGCPAVVLAFCFAADGDGMSAAASITMTRGTPAAIVMAVNFVHGLSVITDRMCLAVITMRNAVAIGPPVTSFASCPAVSTKLVAVGIMMMDIFYRITAAAVLRIAGMVMIFIFDGSWNLIHADHDLLVNAQYRVMDFLERCILVDYDVLREQCGCKECLTITHTLKNRLDVAG